ncbi:hypothetical protein THUN1379_13590 [Paludibacterium sp. THUN1379]|uniref:CesT family type III secretion system chaperone n=1 Tax=Paludibacterium sp. THUN1379 TaxID=3112107 RepID=UPI0030886D21|nr:hypothetical protein THUN1379_13590 [Paludibacterium sp. THUN1379]
MTPFDDALQHLARHLGLNRLARHGDMVSVPREQGEVFLSALPANYLLMFVLLDEQPLPEGRQLLALNHFSHEPLRPTVAFDRRSGNWLLWSRQPLGGGSGMTDVITQFELLETSLQQVLEQARTYPAPVSKATAPRTSAIRGGML